jgi:peroxiredoxin
MEKLKEHSLLPVFELESTEGEKFSPQQFKEKENLVVVLFDTQCIDCVNFLKELADNYQDYKDEETEILAIGMGTMDELKKIKHDNHLPYPLLFDKDAHIIGTYAESSPAVYVTDRFGEIRYASYEHFPEQQDVLNQLGLVELECPECGVPTWST